MPRGSFTKETRKKMPPRGPGKLNKAVKETVLNVFNELQGDPKYSLKTFAKDNLKEFYQIAAKLIPTEIRGDIKENITLTIVRGPKTEAE